jgi:hypothetical protein
MTLAWHRLLDKTLNADAGGTNDNDEVDAFFLSVPVTMDGFSVNPYVLYAHHGANATADPGAAINPGLAPGNATALGDDMDIWWGGVNFTMDMFDPFMVMADLIYGTVDGDSNSSNDREGWFFDLAVDYKMDTFTPGMFFVYGSGDDDDPDNGSERFPSLGTGIAGGTTAGFGPTSFGTDGSKASWVGTDKVLMGIDYAFWALGAKVKDLSFIENMTHTLVVMYGGGTNDPDFAKKGYATGLTEKDHFWEVNVDSAYSMYENLTAYLEIGYINVNLDEEPWENSNARAAWVNPDDTDDAWRCAFTLQYNF